MSLPTEFLPQPQAQPFPTASKIAIGAAAAALVGSFMSWVSVSSIFGSLEVSGFKGGDGKLTAAAAVAAILLILGGVTNRAAVIVAMLAMMGGLIVSLYDWNNLQHLVSGNSSALVQPAVGDGLYLCIAGFGLGLVALWKALPKSAGRGHQTVNHANGGRSAESPGIERISEVVDR